MSLNVKELMKQVGQIRLITNRLVDEHLSGEYHSVFKGHGIEFDEVREYTPGDDIRSIDWNVTARMGAPFVKRFCEERELTILFLVDVSGSQAFGSGQRAKSELAAEITCVLALSAIKNQDKIGLILFSDRIEKSIPPRKGRTAAMRLVREVLATEETRRGTDLAGALRFLNQVQKRRAVVFIISDFMDTGFERELRVTARRHDVICCSLSDPREEELPDVGLLEIQDPETGELELLDTSSTALRDTFRDNARQEQEARAKLFRKHRIDALHLSTDRPFIEDIHKLFHQRQVRAARG
ncbi:MAG: DUF58 domain-containing protein [bacterium]